MRWPLPLAALCLAVPMSGCGSSSRLADQPLPPAAAITADYDGFGGREFLFRARSESLRRFGYNTWRKEPDYLGEKLSYEAYVGKKGKLAPDPVAGSGGTRWYAALVESGETVYGEAGDAEAGAPDAFASAAGICFLDTIAEATQQIGQTVWSRRPGGGEKTRVYITRDSTVTYPRTHLDGLTIEGVDTTMYAHGTIAPLHLVAKTSGGAEVLLPYRKGYYYDHDPVQPTWGKDIVRMIQEQKVRPGMTQAQVALSWGTPARTTKSRGAREMWYYPDGEHLEFKDGTLVGGKGSR